MLPLTMMNLERLEQALITNHGDLPRACKELGFDLRQVNRWVAGDEEVAAAITAAQQLGWSTIESAVVERAIHGYEKPIYQKGELAGYETVYSDTLLALLAKARVPGYRPDPAATAGGVTVNVAVMPRANTYEEWVAQRDQTLEASYEEVTALPPPTEVLTVWPAPATSMSALKDIL